ncbi:MAG TPA: glutamate--tRNA ligase [Candidatus Polarisedimenticolia bacterium]|jgi:glutamyl-tRNA synthetase|nr:glutamate--tRNA ligase [Candidatus Polarisedimenticolia bacterium]
MTPPRVRFAPSPTGELHVGNARTALFNWLFARRHRGVLILRVEDTDAARSRPDHETRLLDDLRWLGLGWDEGVDEGGENGPYRQSERLSLYQDKADDLIGRGLAYPCFCSQQMLEEERAAQREAGRASLYPGRCRRIPRDEAARRRAAEPAAVRFNVGAAAAGDTSIAFEDLVHGEVRFPMSQIGDFVILRRDGWPSYNFAVVVDDLQMRVSHVIRGDDHLSNTPRQLLVYGGLRAPALPRFAHLPLIAGPGGAPLSKREGAASLAWFREEGYPPEALMNYLALLGWSPPGGQDLLTKEELVAQFGFDRVSRAPAIFDRPKLDALAARHMARLPADRLVDLASEQLRRAGYLPAELPAGAREWIGRLALLYAERLPRMSNLPTDASVLFDFAPPKSLADPEVRQALLDPRSRGVIEALARRLGEEPLTAPRFQALADEVRRETGAKGRDLYHPIRIALTGSPSGPEMVKFLPVIEEGSRLPLPRPIVPCAERARSLLAATRASTS